MRIRLTDGTEIGGLSQPLQGTRHRLVFGTDEASGRKVAAKIELIPGALKQERVALEWLSALEAVSPQFLAAGALVGDGDDAGALCLVMERVDGEAPRSAAGWKRLGQSLARLSKVPWHGSALDTYDHKAFLGLHERRIDDLGRGMNRRLRTRLPTAPSSFFDSRLTLTHGDPGPGNFLDQGDGGILIDWEDAQIAPWGLDLGRAMFIALLGAGPEGYEAREHAARASAVVTGFLAEADDWSPDQDDLAWWLSVAGVQFAHRRLARAGQPGVLPWLDAVGVLEAALEEIPGP